MTSTEIKQKVQIIVTTDDSVLLLKLNKDRGGIWQNATGSVEKNESYIEAAERELGEETGIFENVRELPLTIEFHDQWGFNVIEKVFSCHLKYRPRIRISDEHDDYKWVKFENLIPKDYGFPSHYQGALLAKENHK